MATTAISDIRKDLEDIVGQAAISDDPEAFGSYTNCLGPVKPPGPERPLLVVRPADTAQVQSLVRLANELGLNLIPASSGAPHVHGGTAPYAEGVIVDLSSMNRIVRMNRLHKVAIIEPGVTFGQLKEEAARQDLRPLMPLLPRATKSVLASYLEREPITFPRFHWDMTDPLLCTELVFGTGDLMRTGSAAGPGTLEQQWEREIQQKNPTGGPGAVNFVQLFQASQGTMGIATWASIKLEMLPKVRRPRFVPEADLDRLIDFSYRMLRLKLGDEFLILNRFALANLLAEDPAEIKALAEKQAPYTLFYCVAGYQHFPEKRVEFQEHDIAGVAQHYAVLPRDEVPGASAVRMLEILDNPSPEPYWKLRFKGGFREISFITTMDRAPSFIALMEETASSLGYAADEVAAYLQPMMQGRNCHVEFNLFYDPADEGEAQRAGKVFDAAGVALSDAGAFFSRPYGPLSDIAYAGCPDTVATLRKVKQLFDPNGVMNRGKLCFEEV